MKIGQRNFTSFADFMAQFQEYALEHPMYALADIAIVSVGILAISVLF